MVEEVSSTMLPVSKNISDILGSIKQEVGQIETRLASQVKQKVENTMADTIMTPTMPMLMGGGYSGGGDGLFGGGAGGGGLIGGLILGSLLRNGNGGLFGGGGDGGIAGAVLRNPPEQNQANMDLMASIGAVDKAVAVSTAAMEGSQAAQTSALNASLNSVASSLVTRIDGTKEAVNAGTMVLAQQLNALNTNLMSTANETQRTVYNDGDKTRALITQQYEMNLQRQLADANAAIIELRGDSRLAERTRGIEVTTTNNINQMQTQQQQQQQFAQLGNYIALLAQQIRSSNEAINVGSGTLTANPANTNTNIR